MAKISSNSDLKGSMMSLRIIGIVMGLLGLLAANALIPTVEQAISQSGWNKTECTIDASEFKAGQFGADSLVLQYHYTVNGSALKGTQYEARSNVSYAESYYRELAQKLQPGTNVACYFDPVDPQSVVIERTSWGDAATILIPGVFILIAALMLLVGRKRSAVDPLKQFKQTHQPESPTVSVNVVGWGRIIFFSLFILVGLGGTYLFFGMSFLALQQAKSWVPARCTMLESSVSASTSRDRETGKTTESYSLNVRYQYQVGDNRYIGTDYSPAGDRFIDREHKYQLAEQLSRGEEIDCFIDPLDATRSALNRDTPNMIYAGLLPLIFSAAGLLGLVVTGDSRPSARNQISGMAVQRRAQSRLKGFIGYILMTIVWNAIVAGVVISVCFESGWQLQSVIPLLIASPFLLIGVLLIVGIPYVFLQLFNPTVDIELSAETPRLGASFLVGWKLNGNPRRVRELVVSLQPKWRVALAGDGVIDDLAADDEDVDEIDDQEDETEEASSSQELDNATARSPIGTPKEAVLLLRKMLTMEVIKPFVVTGDQAVAAGRTTFQIPNREQLEKLGPGLTVEGWKVTITLKIPWYPDSMEIFEFGSNTDSLEG